MNPIHERRQGLILATTNLDEDLVGLKRPPLIVNDLDIRYPEDKEKLEKYLMTKYDEATFSMVPSCDCGKTAGGYMRGKVCPHCDSMVLTHTEIPLESDLWLRVPEGVTAFINPIHYNKLSEAFKASNIDVIRWLADIHYKGNFNENPIVQKLRAFGVKRGYNNFIEHFDEYINILLTGKIYTSSSDKRRNIMKWLDENKANMFSQYLPLPNRISLVTERNATGRYGEILKFGGGVEAANTMASLNTRIDVPSLPLKESITFRCVLLLTEYHKAQYKFSIGKKEGLVRKHICGGRMPFTARNVITSLHGVHEYDELHIPWAMAIGLFRLHLVNKFLRDGYSPNEAYEILHGYVNREHPLIRQYFNELLAECKYKGLPVCFNRNPTLLRGSIQKLYVTKIKDNINDNTISLSVLILNTLNADFDGDALNLYYSPDNFQSDNFDNLKSHTSVWSLSVPFEVSGTVNLERPIYETINNFIKSTTNPEPYKAVKPVYA